MSTDIRKKIYMFTLCLTCLIVLFIVLIQLSGPRIRNTTLKQNLTNQQLIITYNADISSINSISIEPSIQVTYSHDTFQLFINFDSPLRYGTTYVVTIDSTDSRNKSSVQKTEFVTINPYFYYLHRSDYDYDTIYRATLESDKDKVVYQSESILLYDFTAKSMTIVQQEDNEQKALVIINDKSKLIPIPDEHTVDSIDASTSEEKYLFTLLNTKTFVKSVWEFMVAEDKIYPVLDDQSRQLIGSDAQYAPDGKSIFFINDSRSLVLMSSDASQPPINIGSFDVINRILPSEKGVFGLKNNTFTTILSNDGSELIAPDTVQNASLTQQLNSLLHYVYVEQKLDSNSLHLEQGLISYLDNTANLLRLSSNNERLILNTMLSPNDEFVLTEESMQPVIYDGIYPNGKPKDGFTNITSIKTGKIIKSINGYDIKWSL